MLQFTEDIRKREKVGKGLLWEAICDKVFQGYGSWTRTWNAACDTASFFSLSCLFPSVYYRCAVHAIPVTMTHLA